MADHTITFTLLSKMKGAGFKQVDEGLRNTSRVAATASRNFDNIVSRLDGLPPKLQAGLGAVSSILVGFARGGLVAGIATTIGLAVGLIGSYITKARAKVEELEKKLRGSKIAKAFDEATKNAREYNNALSQIQRTLGGSLASNALAGANAARNNDTSSSQLTIAGLEGERNLASARGDAVTAAEKELEIIKERNKIAKQNAQLESDNAKRAVEDAQAKEKALADRKAVLQKELSRLQTENAKGDQQMMKDVTKSRMVYSSIGGMTSGRMVSETVQEAQGRYRDLDEKNSEGQSWKSYYKGIEEQITKVANELEDISTQQVNAEANTINAQTALHNAMTAQNVLARTARDAEAVASQNLENAQKDAEQAIIDEMEKGRQSSEAQAKQLLNTQNKLTDLQAEQNEIANSIASKEWNITYNNFNKQAGTGNPADDVDGYAPMQNSKNAGNNLKQRRKAQQEVDRYRERMEGFRDKAERFGHQFDENGLILNDRDGNKLGGKMNDKQIAEYNRWIMDNLNAQKGQGGELHELQELNKKFEKLADEIKAIAENLGIGGAG